MTTELTLMGELSL